MSRLKTRGPVDSMSHGYDRDVYAWSMAQVDLLRRRRFEEADLVNIIEEIESLGRSERRSLKASYRLVIMHLLKWQYQPDRRSISWTITIGRERGNIALDERDNPSLAAQADVLVAEVYATARRDAADETVLPLHTFPDTCPYTLDYLRDRDALPD